MTEKNVFALCSAILFAVLALGIMMSGPGVARGLIAFALAFGGAGQFIAQDGRDEALKIAWFMSMIALAIMAVATTYYALEAITA